MSAPLLFSLDGNAALAAGLRAQAGLAAGACEIRHFPDGESYVRIDSDCRDRDTVLLCSLARPDALILPLLFCAGTLRELGARSVGLVVPYLAYMRQDKRFNPGEAVSSRLFAPLLSERFDWLVTADPHLHRYHSLDVIYTLPNTVVHSAPLLSDWIRREVQHPLLIGPDGESAQWVQAVAERAGAPFQVLEKVRRGDRDVEVSAPAAGGLSGHTPVLVDDIASTGRTLLEGIAGLRAAGLPAPVCVVVHGLFADDAYAQLRATAARVVTTNAVAHPSNAIDLSALLAQAVAQYLPRPV